MKIWGEMTLWDKLLIGALIVIGVAGMVVLPVVNETSGKKDIIIRVQGNEVKRISINSSDSKVYDFKFGSNTGYIEVKDGSVRMQKMPKSICPEGICSDTGWISNSYQTIVCLPNKIIVSIEKSQNEDIDTLSY